MAERALLASRRADGTYAVAASRWGGTDRTLAAVADGVEPTAVSGIEWETGERYPDFPAVVAELDILSTELCYRVDDGITVFLPLWFGLPLASVRARPGVGGLVAVGSLADARACRRWFRRLKDGLADAATWGAIPWPAVPLVLVASVAALAPRERYLVIAGTAERL